MALFNGLYLCPNCFSWPEGQKKDGTARKAGEYVAFLAFEQGPTPQTSSVVEIQVPDSLRAEFQRWQILRTVLEDITCYIEYTGKGKARLQGFGA